MPEAETKGQGEHDSLSSWGSPSLQPREPYCSSSGLAVPGSTVAKIRLT